MFRTIGGGFQCMFRTIGVMKEDYDYVDKSND